MSLCNEKRLIGRRNIGRWKTHWWPSDSFRLKRWAPSGTQPRHRPANHLRPSHKQCTVHRSWRLACLMASTQAPRIGRSCTPTSPGNSSPRGSSSSHFACHGPTAHAKAVHFPPHGCGCAWRNFSIASWRPGRRPSDAPQMAPSLALRRWWRSIAGDVRYIALTYHVRQHCTLTLRLDFHANGQPCLALPLDTTHMLCKDREIFFGTDPQPSCRSLAY